MGVRGRPRLPRAYVTMDGATAGLIGGILGSVLGCLGGALGTYFSIRNARPGPQRRFMIKSSVAMWIIVLIMAGMIWASMTGLLPQWTVWLAQGLFFILLGPAIYFGNKRYANLAKDE